MKKLLIIILLACGTLAAQEKTYQIPESQLTEQQRQKFGGTSNTVQDVHAWVGVGKEIGTAVNDSLAAITTQSNNFAQTPVGKLTVAVVIFKVLGDTAIHIVAGFAIFICMMPLWIWSYRRFLPKRVVKSEVVAPDKTLTRTFETLNAMDDDEANGWRIGHWGALLALGVVILFTVFSY